jgi:hypothetical protein
MKKIVFSALVTALAFASAPAFADQPNGELIFKTNNGNNGQGNSNSGSNGSAVGKASSQIIQNGQFVSGTADVDAAYNCQATSCTGVPGSRAEQVHELLGK